MHAHFFRTLVFIDIVPPTVGTQKTVNNINYESSNFSVICAPKKELMNISGNKILITGGASGIGFGIAERFIQDGNTVIVCGRRQEALQEAADKLPGLVTKQCDLTLKGGREELYHWITANHSDLNVLINNAGIQNWMSITDDDFMERATTEIVTNIEAPLHLTKLFMQLPTLKTVMNVTSGLAFFPFTKVPVYSATKAFFHSFTLSLRVLLQPHHIEVIEVIPPALNTDLGGKGLHDHAPAVSDFIEAIFAQLKEGKTELTFGFTEAISKAGQEVVKPIFERINGLSSELSSNGCCTNSNAPGNCPCRAIFQTGIRG